MRVNCKYKTITPKPMVYEGQIVAGESYGLAWVEIAPQLNALGTDGDDALEALMWRLQFVDWLQAQPVLQH